MPAPRRGQAVRRCADLLREHKDALGTLVTLENGKIKAEGDGEVQEMIDIAEFAVGQSRMLYGKTLHSERPAHRMYEQWHPLGVVGVVTAFNFPVAVWAWNAMLACVCGNATVWKPSPKTPLCALAASHLANRVVAELGLPPDVRAGDRRQRSRRGARRRHARGAAVVHGIVAGRQSGCRNSERPLRQGSARDVAATTPIVVAEDADLDLVVPAVVFGAVGTAGQRCTTTRRLIVHDSQYDALLARLAAAYAQVRIGDPMESATLMGPLIDRAAVEQFTQAVGEARAAGATIAHGGHAIDGAGLFVEPTLVTGVDNTMRDRADARRSRRCCM